MALTTNEITLSNIAMSYIGSKSVSASNTTALEYTLAERFIDQARDEILRRHPWNSLMKASKTYRTGKHLGKFDHSYLYPTDCLRMRQVSMDWDIDFAIESGVIVTDGGGLPADWKTATEYAVGDMVQIDDDSDGTKTTFQCAVAHTSATFASETANWTSIGDEIKVLDVLYIKQETDPANLDANLYNCVALNLAKYLAYPLTQDSRLRDSLINELETVALPRAKSCDAQEGVFEEIETNTYVQSRVNGRLGRYGKY